MRVSRRAILTTGAATAAILAIGGTRWAGSREARKAREPWRAATTGFGDPRLDVLAYAILAPNPHNMQPWQIRLEDELDMSIFCALDRRLPATDPLDRQITIGFGCFLELMRQAAAEKGFRAENSLFPEGEPQPRLDSRPIAAITLIRDEKLDRDPLFGGALARRTSRLPFDTKRKVGVEALSSVLHASVPGVAAHATADEAEVRRLRQLTVDGWAIEWSTPATRRESIAVMRIGKAEINADPDGLVIEGPMMEVLNMLGAVTREKMDQPETRAYAEGFSSYAQACETAMAYAWTTTDSNTRQDQIEAGRAWVRMQLAATAAGLAFHPISQVLQEYPEMAELYGRVHDVLRAEGGQVVQMLSRLGYAPDISPAPRWPLKSRLIPA